MTRLPRILLARAWARLTAGLAIATGLCVTAIVMRAAPASDATPPAGPPETTHKAYLALREFDLFLNHHPLLEDELRISPQLATNPAFLRANPELRDFLAVNHTVAAALVLEPRHFLHRALIRQANVPLRRTDIVQFDPLFDRAPDLERALARNPESIHDSAFLRTHAELREFFATHSTLSHAFLPPTKKE